MKKIIGLVLFLTLSSHISAKENFGGIYLDSSIPKVQIQTLKEDFIYLYNTPETEVDSEFKTVFELTDVNGAELYNWVFNRVRYIVGQDYKRTGRNLLKKKGHVFPSTPLPDGVFEKGFHTYGAVIIMSNLGAELYLTGKNENILKGLRLNREEVYVPSPRTGIVQVGEGLFLERLLVNKEQNSEANKIKRLGTIFHEARHSDGNAEHVGFIHNVCPTGHALSGFYACESSRNGSYSLEAHALKMLLTNCHTCSIEDQTKLSASITDSLSRVVVRSHLKTEEKLLEEIEAFQRVVEFYENLFKTNPDMKKVYESELIKFQGQLSESEAQLVELRTPKIPKFLDPMPEGHFYEVLVEDSSELMEASLSR